MERGKFLYYATSLTIILSCLHAPSLCRLLTTIIISVLLVFLYMPGLFFQKGLLKRPTKDHILLKKNTKKDHFHIKEEQN